MYPASKSPFLIVPPVFAQLLEQAGLLQGIHKYDQYRLIDPIYPCKSIIQFTAHDDQITISVLCDKNRLLLFVGKIRYLICITQFIGSISGMCRTSFLQHNYSIIMHSYQLSFPAGQCQLLVWITIVHKKIKINQSF